MLCLYEAASLSVEGEIILDNAKEFTTRQLIQNLEQEKNENLAGIVDHALEIPLQWRMKRLESRWFIDIYEKRHNFNPVLLGLAKLDFNIVQAIHQQDLKHMSRWWRNTGLGEKLSFARDSIVENFFWTVGLLYAPQYVSFRRESTKLNALITTIDDVYDVYGTLEELEDFTDAIERWDINTIDQLPDYMKICFLAVFNTMNEMAYDAQKDHGLIIISYLKNTDELKRGDVPKSIQCYMNETGASEEDARKFIANLIGEAWKKMNAEQFLNPHFSETFKEVAMNVARTAQCMYQHGDGHGIVDQEAKGRVLSLLIEPIAVCKESVRI